MSVASTVAAATLAALAAATSVTVAHPIDSAANRIDSAASPIDRSPAPQEAPPRLQRPPTSPGGPGLPSASVASWDWPLRPQPDVVAGYDPPDVRWGRGHRGVDLDARVGQQVLAPALGRVTFAGVIAGRPVVVVAHPDGLRSTFEPVVGVLAVGAVVERGTPVGAVGSTAGHCAPAACLHWGVLRGREYLDPLSLLGRRPIVLLPVARE